MEETIKIKPRVKTKVANSLINVYLITVILLGIVGFINDRGGTIGGIVYYLLGGTSLGAEAFIYSWALELSFMILAIAGSTAALIWFNMKYARAILLATTGQLLTATFYLLSKIMMIKGVIHVSSNGMIKVTDFHGSYDFIVTYFVQSSKYVLTTLFLLAGVILLPVLIKISSKDGKTKNKNIYKKEVSND